MSLMGLLDRPAIWILFGAGFVIGCCCPLGLYHVWRCIGKRKHTGDNQEDADSEGVSRGAKKREPGEAGAGGKEASEGGGRVAQKKKNKSAAPGGAVLVESKEGDDTQELVDEEDWGII